MEIRAIAEMRIKPGVEIATVVECARQISSRTEEQDSATIAHNYYADANRRLLVAHEHYEDSEAMIAHLNNMDPDVTQTLMSSVEVLSMRIFGKVSDELREMLTDFGSPSSSISSVGFTRR
ncbi:hypothetical protein [Saccharomonospora viridis]|uniref:ABM domain-containing protein n=1 Tax=Saccharomonospora viridis TaxID=1852 RepID=A0A837D6A0_9PSEU|nr:hypothetical protein [Saccharomonospora viridis]KHF42982.1 hypothetical protein MINT15_31840 [Saccharomonospora viridis]SFO87020.1 hypothetical protein SAMN02982918_0588 [Saccharomonospora viridis]